MELSALFGKTDLADWHDDAAYREVKAAEDAAGERQRACYDRYNTLWRLAQPSSDVSRLPPPGHPCWAARNDYEEAASAWTLARQAREQAEASAKESVRAAGEAAGRHKWEEFGRDVLPHLLAWCREYSELRVEVEDKTAVQLPDVSGAVCVESETLTIWHENVRRAFAR
jgi:hypothetical protein